MSMKEKIFEQLQDCQKALENGYTDSAQQEKKLKERAEALAREVKNGEEKGVYLQVVEFLLNKGSGCHHTPRSCFYDAL